MIGLNIITYISRLKWGLEKAWTPLIFFFYFTWLNFSSINNNDELFAAFVDFQKHLTILCVNFCSLNLWR